MSWVQPQAWQNVGIGTAFIQESWITSDPITQTPGQMLVEQAIQQLLRQDVSLTALVGDRIYQGLLPQRLEYPAIVYRLHRRASEPLASERGTGPTESQYAFFSVMKGPDGYMLAKLVDEAIRLCLQGYAGTVILANSSPPVGVKVHGIFFATSADGYVDRPEIHQAGSVYDVSHAQVVPT